MKALLALAVLWLPACADGSAQPPAPPSPCREQRFEGSGFIVCTPASAAKLRLFAAGRQNAPQRAFSDLGLREADVAFGMNAGMFDVMTCRRKSAATFAISSAATASN